MFRNYLKVAVRNLLKKKGYSLIKVLGLATGMAAWLLIILFVQSEKSYDKYQEKADNIYRVVLDRKYPGRSTSYSIIPQSIGWAIKTEFPEVQDFTRLFNFAGDGGNFFIRIDDKVFEEKNVLAVDSNFFNIFSGKAIKGNLSTALMQPNSVVLNETTAKKYFGSAEAAINKTFKIDGDNNPNSLYKITAVCADWPENSHFLFGMLLSVNSFPFAKQTNYINFSAHTYLLLKPGTSPAALEAKFPQIVTKYVAGEIEKNFGQTAEQFQKNGNGYQYYLQPLRQIHLISNLEAELRPNGSQTAVYIFSVVAIFILVLACINFINLSTARSVERAKEVGIRKTFGSERKALINQFLLESIVVSLISMIVAFALIIVLLPLFNQLTGKSLSVGYFLSVTNILYLLAFAIFIGLLAGLYPALILSSFKPILVLKGRFKSQKYGLALRNGLVVFQFSISVILIVCSIIVNKQMRFMLGEKLGFRKDHVIIVERTDLIGDQTKAFKNELAKTAGVEAVSGAFSLPGQDNFFGVSYQVMGSKEQVTGRGVIADESYIKVLGLELKEGRFFSKEYSTDSLSILLNEKAVAELGLKNPIGARLISPDGQFNAPDGSPYGYTVIGVLKDFHFQSLHQKISPLIVNNTEKFRGVSPLTALRIKAANFDNAVSSIETIWKKFVKDRPFNYKFLDDTLARQYHGEQTMQKIFTIFSTLAIFIACIGLLGLAAYTTQQRTREISIRKVLGASVTNIITLLSKDFIKLVVIAAVIAFPLAWLGMNKWLEDFAYRVDISWWIFLAAAGGAVMIALLTISFQAIKAALMNPVKSLRSE